jgi:hypothetical protein
MFGWFKSKEDPKKELDDAIQAEWRIVQEYAKNIEKNIAEIASIDLLSYSKKRISEAIDTCISASSDGSQIQDLSVLYVSLADFQPISEDEAMAIAASDISQLSASGLSAGEIAKAVVKSGPIMEKLRSRVIEEQRNYSARVEKLTGDRK